MNNSYLAIGGGVVVFLIIAFILFDGQVPDTKPIERDNTTEESFDAAQDNSAELETEVRETTETPAFENGEFPNVDPETTGGPVAPAPQPTPSPASPAASQDETSEEVSNPAPEPVPPVSEEEEIVEEDVVEEEAHSTSSAQATSTEEVVVDPEPEPEPEPQGDVNLLGYWKFDETSGSIVADSSIYGNTATVQAGNSVPSWITGQINGGLDLDGLDDYVLIPHSDSLNLGGVNQSYSISVWVQWDTKPSRERRLIGKGGRSGTLPFALRVNNDGEPFVRVSDVFSAIELASNQSIAATGRWHHIVFVRNAETNTLHLYKDGEQADVKPDTTTKTMENTHGITINRYELGPNSYQFDRFKIDDVQIYDRVLSSSEISTAYAENK